MSDNLDSRAILAAIPSHIVSELEVDLPLAVIPCLRADHPIVDSEGAWVE